MTQLKADVNPFRKKISTCLLRILRLLHRGLFSRNRKNGSGSRNILESRKSGRIGAIAKLLHQTSHFQSIESVIPTMIAFNPSPFQGLSHIIRCQNAENNWNSSLKSCCSNAFSRFSRHIIEMGSLSPNDCPEANTPS